MVTNFGGSILIMSIGYFHILQALQCKTKAQQCLTKKKVA